MRTEARAVRGGGMTHFAPPRGFWESRGDWHHFLPELITDLTHRRKQQARTLAALAHRVTVVIIICIYQRFFGLCKENTHSTFGPG